MIHKRYYSMVFAFLMASIMSFLMSGVITYINLGLQSTFIDDWIFKAFPSAFIVAFPIALFVVPIVKRVVDRLTK